MADIDTGLGWYAEGEWLANSSGAIGTLESSGGGGSGMVDTGLGWSAKADYLQTAPQTYLTIAWNGGSRSYSKASGGYAICVRLLRRDWSGLAIISTVEDNAKGFDTYDSTPRAPRTFTYKGLTWYSYYEDPMQGAPTNYTLSGSVAIVEIYDDYGMTDADCLKYVIDVATAGFEVINTGYGWAARSYWLKNEDDITLAEVLSTPYGNRLVKKSRPGYTIAVAIDSSDWCGVLTISTDAMSVMQSVNGQDSGGYATFEYLGYTWTWADGYMFNTYGYSGVRQLIIPRYTIYGNYGRYGSPDRVASVKRIIDTAGVTTQSVAINTYNKSGSGYSVTCMCKWKTSIGGDAYFSPILISSDPNYTLYTRNGASPSVGTTDHSYQGMTFYMRKAPLDTLTGAEVIESNYPVVDLTGFPQSEATIFAQIATRSNLHVGYAPAQEDPYEDGGTSGPGGGGGSFDNTSDQIDDSTTPVFSFAGSGFCRIYNPNLSQLQNLANYLWTDTNFLQTIINHAKQLLEDPIEAVISLAMLPVAIPQGTSETVKVLFISTGVSMPPATTQYVEVDCGTYNLEEYYGSALDYNPYTQVDLYLPFIGQVSLNTDEVMGHTIGVKYRVDIVSGLCVAKVFVDNDCMYQFSGNCAIFMPLNSADFSSYLSAAMTVATALVSAGAGAAAGAAAAGAEAVAEPAIQTGGNLLTSGESLVTPQMALQYRVEESIRPMYSPSGSEGSPSASLGEMERKFINNSAAAVMGSKIGFEHASHLAGNSGILGIRRPYLIINRPDMCNPEKYGKYNGRPCMMYLYLGNLTGYTEIQEVQLTGFSATNPELAEISKMLKGGVIF